MNASLSVRGFSMRLRLRASYRFSLIGFCPVTFTTISLRIGFNTHSCIASFTLSFSDLYDSSLFSRSIFF